MGVIYFTTYYANQNKGRADSTLEIQNSEFRIQNYFFPSEKLFFVSGYLTQTNLRKLYNNSYFELL